MTQAHARPSRRERSKQELRCFCRSEPMLAMYGIDEDGELYVHVRIYKQKRLYSESWHSGGVLKLRCRNCLRWHTVTFPGKTSARLVESAPPVVAIENGAPQ